MTEKKDKLTLEQEIELERWRKMCDEMVLSTQPADRPLAERAIKRIYKFLGKKEPQVIWELSPLAQKKKAEELFPTVESAQYLAGKHDSYYIAFRKFFTDVLNYDIGKNQELLDAMWDLAKSCMWVIELEGVAIACEREEEIHLNDRNMLHNEYGAAILFRDGAGVYCYNGVRVPKHVIVDPGSITAEEIKNEPNMEVREVMYRQYGWDRWLKNVNAKLIDRCADPGNVRWKTYVDPATGEEHQPYIELWEFFDVDGRTKIQIVKCINGTPETDGTFKTYGIRVRANFKSALKAIISTYPAIAQLPNAEEIYSGMVRT